MTSVNNTDSNKISIDYMLLAKQLGVIKRRMINTSTPQAFTRVTNGENYVLWYLTSHSKPINPKALSNAMNISTARIAKMLNKMEEKNFIKRIADPKDGRQILIQLLPDGKLKDEENEMVFNERAANFLEKLGPVDAQNYVRIQQKIVDIYSE